MQISASGFHLEKSFPLVVGKDEKGKDIIGKGIDFDKLRQELSKDIVEGCQ